MYYIDHNTEKTFWEWYAQSTDMDDTHSHIAINMLRFFLTVVHAIVHQRPLPVPEMPPMRKLMPTSSKLTLTVQLTRHPYSLCRHELSFP